MAWIEVHRALFEHPKALVAAERLGVPVVYVVGHLAALWTWAIDNEDSGVLPGASAWRVAHIAQWPGDPATFLDAMVTSGFLEQCGADVVIHDWMDYAGRLVEKRRADAARKHAARHPTDVQRMSDGQDADSPAPSGGHPTAVQPLTVTLNRDHDRNPNQGSPPEGNGAAAPAPPAPPLRVVPKRVATKRQPTPEGYALLTRLLEMMHGSLDGDERRRAAILADELLNRCQGDADEAAAWMRHRLERGDSPDLRYVVNDYSPGWRVRAQRTARASPNGHSGKGLSVSDLLAIANGEREL